jgi:hypothetical protein
MMKRFLVNAFGVVVFCGFLTVAAVNATEEIDDWNFPVVCANNSVPDDCSKDTKGLPGTNASGLPGRCWWDSNAIPAACVCP